MSRVAKLIADWQSPSDDAVEVAKRELIALNARVQQLIDAANQDLTERKVSANASETWDELSEEVFTPVYDYVFTDEVCTRVYELADVIGSRFDYYDPDGSYTEDVVAFTTALADYVRYL